MKKFLKRILYKLIAKAILFKQQQDKEAIYKKFNIPSSVRIDDTSLEGNIIIGAHTYINNGGRIDSGPLSKVAIGKHCAIGRYVHITSKTHDLKSPTTSEKIQVIPHIEKDVSIGDYVWIGDKVFVGPGITIGDYAIIGANSVVTQNVGSFEIVAGNPARIIRHNKDHIDYNFKNITRFSDHKDEFPK